MPGVNPVNLDKQPKACHFPEGPLRSLTKLLLVLGLCALGSTLALAQHTPKITLDISQQLFAVTTAMNTCGYDADLADSNAIRAQVRAEVAEAVQGPRAQQTLRRLCAFYSDHQQPDTPRELAQYVSLALHLSEAPAFTPTVAEADLPPDAQNVLGFVPLLQNFWISADLNRIWNRYAKEYNQLVEQFHKPVTDLLFTTDIYLKQPLSGYVGRGFTVYVEPMAAPGQVNARNYGTDYYMVISPEKDSLQLDKLRHTYLHYVLDPLVLKRANTMKRLSPLLEAVATSPMEDIYKQDISMLVTESLIRAIEARLEGGEKGAEAGKQARVNAATREGFILTRHFYDQLVTFEKLPTGLKDAYGDWLYSINVQRELKNAKSVQFASVATPEIVRAESSQAQLLNIAEAQLASGNRDGAEKLARRALDEDQDSGHASFILARVATLKGDMQGAEFYFEKASKAVQDPKMLAWSHIYLGRIADLKDERETALAHYKAALGAGEIGAEAQKAAESGMQKAYQPANAVRKH